MRCAKSVKKAIFLVLLVTLSSEVWADGMIVPIRPDIRVRGSWAVKYHHVNIKVREQVAFVEIDQEFINTGRRAIEVEYLFPVPPGAAIDSMTMLVNGKEFSAKLMNADQARKIYESIVRKKKDPALLEYAGFGLYRTRAFPLEPGKPCRVVVTYKNLCKKDCNLVEVWYPLNTEKYSATKINSVEVSVDIAAASDVTAVYSPTHDIAVARKSPRRIIATYKAKDVLPETDFQLFYRAADEKVGATLITHQGDADGDGYFMLLVSPNPRDGAEKIAPKDLMVVFDRSGSMSGKKIRQAVHALSYILNNLNKADRFNVIAYSDSIDTFFDGDLVGADKGNIEKALGSADRLSAAGGTDIHGALTMAMKMLSSADSEKSRPKYIIFLTDGLPTVGKTNINDIIADTSAANKCRARLFAFGVGYDVNVKLLDKLVEQNNGRSDYVKPAEPIEAKISSFYAKIKNPVMTDIEIDIPGVKMRDTYPRRIGDLFEGDQIVLVGRYQRRGDMSQTQLVVKGMYRGRRRGFEYPVKIQPAGKDMRYVFVEKLWAIRRVGFLLDQIQLHGKTKEVVDELIKLSLTYGIMTPQTSFLADESTQLNRKDKLHSTGIVHAERLAEQSDGSGGQVAAKNRQALKYAAAPTSAGGRYTKGSRMYGNTSVADYEAGKDEVVAGVRNIGGQALYRRGKTWIASNASDVDLKKDKDKIKTVSQFSEEYFQLVKANTTEQNQVLASQQPGERLLVKLRGQVYMIE